MTTARERQASIPAYVYTCIRAVYESRMRRLLDSDVPVPSVSNTSIFQAMPDCDDIIWTAAEQPELIEATIALLITFGRGRAAAETATILPASHPAA